MKALRVAKAVLVCHKNRLHTLWFSGRPHRWAFEEWNQIDAFG